MHFKQFNIKKADNCQTNCFILNVQKKQKLRILVDIYRFKDV